MKTQAPASPRHGFTLIELLTVIAIIGILAAIVIPVTGRVRASARSAQCLSNLRQIGNAAQLWSIDNKGVVVPVFDPGDPSAANWKSLTTWVGMLAPYAGWKKPDSATAFTSSTDAPIFMCPERKDVFGYGYNFYYLSWIGTGLRRLVRYDQVPSLSQTIMLADVIYTTNTAQWRPFVRLPYKSDTDSVVDYRHPGSTTNLLWLDGHVSKAAKGSTVLMDEKYWGVDVPRSESPL